MKIFGTKLGIHVIGIKDMVAIKKKIVEKEEQEWEDPMNPEKPSDDRDKEQIERLYEEAKRRKDNLSEKDHIDRKPKTD
ncbi:MAG: hypothetical protein JWP37_3136 [Mucilaginibacter sp.]|nr:hypothetical protein [Mucilaginibacter sp.]